ncbi:MAG: PAS domain S-box protein [Archangium sp.]|nr:PAS domain S-box protein [Archangium sp.]
MSEQNQFRLAIEAAPAGMLMVDHAGKIVLVNAQVEKLFGYRRDELIGQPIEMLVPERFRANHPASRGGLANATRARPMGAGRELFGLRADGSEVPVEIGLSPLKTDEGDFILSSIVDVTERRRAAMERERLLGELRSLNAELEQRVRARTSELTSALEEREVLLQEIHHRVKNNLQVISSLINMQRRKLEAGPPRDALQECQLRVQAIALIHEKLYQSKNYARVAFPAYVRSLASSVFHATGVSPRAVQLEVEIDDLALAVDRAIPCGLVLSELISNALKHGFPDGRGGTIKVTLRKLDPGRVSLEVSDDGVGLPPHFDLERTSTLGLQLVRTLAEQLGAKMTVRGVGGASFELEFAVEE